MGVLRARRALSKRIQLQLMSGKHKEKGGGPPVDHYKRKAVRYYEEAPPLANEMRVTTAGRTTDWVRKASAVLESHGQVTVTGSGTVCARAVTVAELLKKKEKKNPLKQECKIKYLRSEDVWEPTKEGLDPLRVVKKVPSISITLEKTVDREDS